MSAIITDQFRRATAQFLAANITGGTQDYFIGIGKSDAWIDDALPPAPLTNIISRTEALRNLATLVRVSPNMVSLVVPNIRFRSGFRYKQYDPSDAANFYATTVGVTTTLPSYVVTSSAIYICLRQGPGTVAYSPTEVTYSPVSSADGYVWVKVAEINDSSTFNTDQFTAVVNPVGAVNTSATEGMVYGFKILSPGTAFNSVTPPIVKLVGKNSTDVNLEISINSGTGAVTAIDFPTGTISGLTFPTGYTQASVQLSGSYPGSGLAVVPLIAPAAGFGDIPINDLPTWFVGVGANVATDMSGDAYYIPYRQISLVREPMISLLENPSDGVDSVDALKFFVVPAGSTVAAAAGSIITQVDPDTGTAAKAFYDSFKLVTLDDGVTLQGRVYYHQNFSPRVNFKDFDAAGSIAITNVGGVGSTTYAYSALVNSEYIQDSGEVLFLENRSPISRNSLQTEEIKLIIQF